MLRFTAYMSEQVMNNSFLHTNAIEDRMLIKEPKLDYSGDELFKVSFSFHENADESMSIIKVSEREKSEAFEGAFSLN